MHRILTLGLALFLICGHCLRAANPDDIDFGMRLVRETQVFHVGESVELEISYSSQSEKKYYGSFTGPTPDVEGATPQVTPMDGVVDLRQLRPDRGGVAGSILSGLGYLSPQPLTQTFDLGQWYRFQKPGHYSVIVTSAEVSLAKRPEEDGGTEPLTLESNPVEFDIVPADPAWAAWELSNIEQVLDAAGNSDERGRAVSRLALLDTPASAQTLVRRYLASREAGEEWTFDSALHKSSQLDIIIRMLMAALSDPRGRTPSTLPELLADLQTREELGIMPPYPSDPENQEKWTGEWQARLAVHSKYVHGANALLAASVERRSGPARAAAIYEVWYDASQLSGTKPMAADELSKLEWNVLAVADDLNYAQRLEFAVMAWQSMPHEQLHSIIRGVAKESLDPPGYDNRQAFELWHEGWPEECDDAILQDIIQRHARTEMGVTLMMSEAEHPELDKMLEEQLKDPAKMQDFGQSRRTAAVILRAGSSNIVSLVDSFLDQTTLGCAGETRGDLLGYLFRVAPDDARKRLSAELQDKRDSCGTEVLRTLSSVRPSDDLIPIVTKALDSPNLVVAQSAALYLGEHGSADVEHALWRRLEALWDTWQGRTLELPNDIMSLSPDARAEAAMLERALASALAHAAHWTLSPDELDHLRSGCLSQTCRDIADGKVSLNL